MSFNQYHTILLSTAWICSAQTTYLYPWHYTTICQYKYLCRGQWFTWSRFLWLVGLAIVLFKWRSTSTALRHWIDAEAKHELCGFSIWPKPETWFLVTLLFCCWLEPWPTSVLRSSRSALSLWAPPSLSSHPSTLCLIVSTLMLIGKPSVRIGWAGCAGPPSCKLSGGLVLCVLSGPWTASYQCN